MKTINHITVIGVGGGGSMLLPALAPAYNLTLVDGDDFEDQNITRQIFSETGRNKATALAEFYNRGNKKVDAVPEMVYGAEVFDTDLIFCCVDNNEARKAAKAIAEASECPLIIIANEEWSPMAWLYLPEFEHTNLDPYTRWGIGKLDGGRQETCAAVEVIEETPQLPQANHVSGGMGLTVMQSLLSMKHSRNYLAEAMATPYPVFKRVKDITP